ncbi:MAG: N-acetylgalactosamine-6-sulfatase [Pirellulaceae bacterium]|nr:MAG: N-acetylgalactosamine-6-sulfatase [Pirellulaceae bacterium]
MLRLRECVMSWRRAVVRWWVATAILFIGMAGGSVCPAERDPLPNIVIILVDDLGVMDSSVPFLTENGKPRKYPLNDFYRTPCLEELARRGVRFSNFYAMSVCSPTRISLMTGQYAARHRTTNWINPDRNNGGPHAPADWNWQGLGPQDVTLARILQQRGYRTIHVGKGHFGPRHSPGADPCNLGFDINIAGASVGAPGSYYGRDRFGAGTPRSSHAVPGLEKYHGQEIYLTEALTREAVAAVREAVNERRPFFLYFAHYAVHAPFQPDPRFADHYRHSGKPAPAQAFASMVEGVDRSLADLVAAIESMGVAENTLLFYLGDNGSDAPLGGPHEVASAAPLRGKKGSHYEGGMRVPFLAAWLRADPEQPWQTRLPIAAGAVQDQVASVCDLFPTLLALLDVPIPDGHAVDGYALNRLLAGQADPQKPQTFLMHYPHSPHRSDYWTSYRKGRWKVIYHYFPQESGMGSHYQLFDLEQDPFEQHDRAQQEPQTLRMMVKEMVEELERCKALYPVRNDGSPCLPVIP